MREAAAFVAGQHSVSAGFLSSLVGAVDRFRRNLRSRRQIVHLSELDDHVLNDIGVTRGDIDAVLSQPLSNDPSRQLQQIALSNRSRWHRR
jgi:uncharacterized protein YjiS (DUF1127 family)